MRDEGRRSRLDPSRLAKATLLLFTFSLGFMQPFVALLGYSAVPADMVYLLLVPVWAAALAAGRARLVWDRAWWPLILYFAALVLSVLASDDRSRSVVKLLTQIYLLSLPVIACSLIESRRDLRVVFNSWLAATAIVVAVGIGTLVTFYLDRANPLLDRTLFHFGTLPPGDYPRVRLTFLNANMLCNYLSVSLMILLGAGWSGWISRGQEGLLAAGIGVSALFTISPGLGGFALVIGLWTWLVLSSRWRVVRRLALACGAALALLFVAAMAVTPILHSTAPYLIPVPLLDLTLAPSGRLMIWTQALANFLADPLFGRGIGADAVMVRYQDPSGHLQRLTDAHNSYLSVAVQAGLPGLAALFLITVIAWRLAAPYRVGPRGEHATTVALGVAFIGGFAYQGLGGSFEDARHLWLLLGLLVASRRLDAQDTASLETRPASP